MRALRFSGILLAYPDLKVRVEGFTDSIGLDEYNQKLSVGIQGQNQPQNPQENQEQNQPVQQQNQPGSGESTSPTQR